MSSFASIARRPLWISGCQSGGWRVAGESDPSARLVPFHHEITDDGAGHFLLVSSSIDGSVYCDTWHETLDDALTGAERQMGIGRGEWSFAETT